MNLRVDKSGVSRLPNPPAYLSCSYRPCDLPCRLTPSAPTSLSLAANLPSSAACQSTEAQPSSPPSPRSPFHRSHSSCHLCAPASSPLAPNPLPGFLPPLQLFLPPSKSQPQSVCGSFELSDPSRSPSELQSHPENDHRAAISRPDVHFGPFFPREFRTAVQKKTF